MLHIDGYLTVYILVLTGVLGAVLGSFINCMAWRIAHQESVLKGRSHCAVCNHTLGALDLVPVFSYLFLRGRCRYCHERISPRYMLTELLMAVIAVSIVWKYDVSFLSLRYLVLLCMLLALALVDLEIYEIPNAFIIAGIVWWVVTLPFMEEPMTLVKSGLIGGFAIAGSILILSMIMDKVLKKTSMGGGDIKLFFVAGLFLGPWVSLLNLILACVLGILLVVVLRQNRIPFGPAISGAVWMSLLFGKEIVQWYLGLF